VNYLLALLGGLQVSDGVMTDLLVRSNVVQEGNKFMEPFVRDGSFLILKIIGAIACIAVLKLLSKRFSRAAFLAGSLAAAFYCGIIAWNFGTVLS
jgi:hypothetical protein